MPLAYATVSHALFAATPLVGDVLPSLRHDNGITYRGVRDGTILRFRAHFLCRLGVWVCRRPRELSFAVANVTHEPEQTLNVRRSVL